MISRISLAIEAGFIDPDAGPVLAFGAPGDADLSSFPDGAVTVVQTLRPDHDAWVNRGVAVQTEATGRAAQSIVFLPRSKQFARSRVAEAARLTDGPVIIDGQKTDGVESILKELKRRADVRHVLSKGHGKLAVIAPGAEVTDWADPGPLDIGGYVTRAGVFSADGPDPGSVLLSEALPSKLGPVVADLGAGWGFLARAILSKDGLSALHLVEADKRALDCARLNVDDDRAEFHWADARNWGNRGGIDTIITNPPFHLGRHGDPGLGVAFIQRAAVLLKPKGQLYLVANRHLPYESNLGANFADVAEIGGSRSYKVFRAARPKQPKV